MLIASPFLGGSIKGGINQKGIEYYNNLINEVKSQGLEPFVTLFHWDVPQALEDKYKGFRSQKIVKDFRDYAELCFKTFGDRVKNWITLNEPLTFSNLGYGVGVFAPGRCSKWVGPTCKKGNSGKEPYIVSHNLLLSHAAAVKIYRQNFQKTQKGQIGISINGNWVVPLNETSEADKTAQQRALAFSFEWFLEPMKSGQYPQDMINNVGKRLPKFKPEESESIKKSYDFIGVNYYASNYVEDIPCNKSKKFVSYNSDSCIQGSTERNGVPIGPKAASDWLVIYPQGIQDLLVYISDKMDKPVLYVTENGVDELNDGKLSLEDDKRIEYLQSHLQFVESSIKKGANVKGYFAWSFLDNFEWADGYSVRFGSVYVDFKNGLKRHPKKSVQWFKQLLHA